MNRQQFFEKHSTPDCPPIKHEQRNVFLFHDGASCEASDPSAPLFAIFNNPPDDDSDEYQLLLNRRDYWQIRSDREQREFGRQHNAAIAMAQNAIKNNLPGLTPEHVAALKAHREIIEQLENKLEEAEAALADHPKTHAHDFHRQVRAEEIAEQQELLQQVMSL